MRARAKALQDLADGISFKDFFFWLDIFIFVMPGFVRANADFNVRMYANMVPVFLGVKKKISLAL